MAKRVCCPHLPPPWILSPELHHTPSSVWEPRSHRPETGKQIKQSRTQRERKIEAVQASKPRPEESGEGVCWGVTMLSSGAVYQNTAATQRPLGLQSLQHLLSYSLQEIFANLIGGR